MLRYPDEHCYRQLHARLMANPELRREVEGAALWAAGILCNAMEEANSWKTPDHVLLGQDYPAIRQFDFNSTRINDPASIVHLINVLQLSREVIWELLHRMHATRQQLP